MILRYFDTMLAYQIVKLMRIYRRIKWLVFGRPPIIRFTDSESDSFDQMIDEFARRIME